MNIYFFKEKEETHPVCVWWHACTDHYLASCHVAQVYTLANGVSVNPALAPGTHPHTTHLPLPPSPLPPTHPSHPTPTSPHTHTHHRHTHRPTTSPVQSGEVTEVTNTPHPYFHYFFLVHSLLCTLTTGFGDLGSLPGHTHISIDGCMHGKAHILSPWH